MKNNWLHIVEICPFCSTVSVLLLAFISYLDHCYNFLIDILLWVFQPSYFELMYKIQLRSLSDSPFWAGSSSLFWAWCKGSSFVVFPRHLDHPSVFVTSHSEEESSPNRTLTFIESRHCMTLECLLLYSQCSA